MMKTRKGFTLVELLIVIVIIGILAAAMLLGSASATAAAEASTIISDLRNMKAASLMFYADNMDLVNQNALPAAIAAMLAAQTPAGTAVNDTFDALGKFMDNPEKFKNPNYLFKEKNMATTGTENKWFVGYKVDNMPALVKENLEKKAKSVGLLAGDATGATSLTATFVKTDDYVWMVAR